MAAKKKSAKKTAPKKKAPAASKPSKDVAAALAAVETIRPPEIPVDKLVGEARALAVTAKKHAPRLAKVGLKASVASLLGGLGEALASGQAALLAARKVGRSVAEVKAEEAARDYRARSLDDLAFAHDADDADAADRISKIREGEGLDDLISDLRQIVTFVREVPVFVALRARRAHRWESSARGEAVTPIHFVQFPDDTRWTNIGPRK